MKSQSAHALTMTRDFDNKLVIVKLGRYLPGALAGGGAQVGSQISPLCQVVLYCLCVQSLHSVHIQSAFCWPVQSLH